MKISFIPLVANDIPIVEKWMEQPHWRQWWGDVKTEINAIWQMIEGKDTTRPFLFHIDDRPTGYIQYWFVKDNLIEPYIVDEPWITLVPLTSVGIDLSIGNKADLSMGIGSKVLKEFALMLSEKGHQPILIDPDPKNLRAIKAYQKAGFKRVLELDGKDPIAHFNVHLMEFSR